MMSFYTHTHKDYLKIIKLTQGLIIIVIIISSNRSSSSSSSSCSIMK